MKRIYSFFVIFLLFTAFLIPATLMQKLFVVKKIFPDAKNIVVLFNKKMISSNITREASIAKTALKLNIILVDVEKKSALGSVSNKYIKSGIHYVIIYSDSAIFNPLGKRLICQKAIKKKIPVITDVKDDFKLGAFASIEENDGKIFIYVSKKVSSILGVKIPEDPKIIIK